MYTGTLINDLMMAADRVAQKTQQQHVAEELHEIFTMQFPITDNDRAYQGAA
jgi:hypothetical protein